MSVYTVGEWSPYDSYGKIAIQLARYLTSQGVRVNCIGLGATVLPSQSDDVQAITSQPILPTLGGLAMGWPTHFAKLNGLFHAGPRVALTMFESSRLPASWLDALAGYDAIITPSHFCADVFRQSGITAPIYVIPLGVTPSRYVQRPQTFSEARPMTFLAFLDRGERKGGVTAMQAFLRAFGDDKKYKLILKAREPKIGFDLTNPNIEVILRDLSEEELIDLYCSADVLLNPHRGEGFGLLPREFAATGGVSLTTDWSGTADGLSFWGVPIPYTLERAGWKGNKGLEGQEVGEWAKVDADELADLLWQVADGGSRLTAQQETEQGSGSLHQVVNWPRQLSRSRARAEFVRERYSWPRFGEQVYQVWKGTTREIPHAIRPESAFAG